MRADVKAELDRLKAANGNNRLDPMAVVAAAKDRNSPLHSFFTWNTREAAAKHLLFEARQLIQQYTITVSIKENEPIQVRHFVSLSTDRVHGGGYRAIADVLSDEQMTDQLLADALAELQVFQAKYARLQKLKPVFDAIAKVTAHAPRVRGRRAAARAEARAS
jgi:hypothetical protein